MQLLMLVFTQSTQVGFGLSTTKLKQSKIKEKYINFRDHRNSTIDIVADTSPPVVSEMDGKPIFGRVYRPWFNRFLLNVPFANEIN